MFFFILNNNHSIKYGDCLLKCKFGFTIQIIINYFWCRRIVFTSVHVRLSFIVRIRFAYWFVVYSGLTKLACKHSWCTKMRSDYLFGNFWNKRIQIHKSLWFITENFRFKSELIKLNLKHSITSVDRILGLIMSPVNHWPWLNLS